ncbi:collagen alpha-1(I) chain-like [Choloepus didactylus]|uniref:collagen alpha-1(I) chain-like n=1 Tax=Choloepus didactylus TaxID=27675 RepID=UPI00189E1B48|nr:collagen alpha-1(I) chain-like [Choloepus didactylus]
MDAAQCPGGGRSTPTAPGVRGGLGRPLGLSRSAWYPGKGAHPAATLGAPHRVLRARRRQGPGKSPAEAGPGVGGRCSRSPAAPGPPALATREGLVTLRLEKATGPAVPWGRDQEARPRPATSAAATHRVARSGGVGRASRNPAGARGRGLGGRLRGLSIPTPARPPPPRGWGLFEGQVTNFLGSPGGTSVPVAAFGESPAHPAAGAPGRQPCPPLPPARGPSLPASARGMEGTLARACLLFMF